MFFAPRKVLVHNREPPINFIIEDLGHSWGTPLKSCLGAVLLNEGLRRYLSFEDNLAFLRFKAKLGVF